MRLDSTTVLAFLLVFVGLFFSVTSSNLYAAGLLSTKQHEIVQTSGVYILALSLAYVVYHGVYDMSRNIRSYEYADRRKAMVFVILGFLIVFLPGIVSQVAAPSLAEILLGVIGLAPIFIALAENYGYIGVLADYIYDRTGNAILAVLLAPVPAVAMHASLPLLVPSYNLLYLYIFFAYMTYASIESGSTLPADVLHVINNALALLYA